MAFVLGDSPLHRLTVDEVMRMLDAGVFEDPQRLELLHGVLTEKSVKSTEHSVLKRRLARWLHKQEHEVFVEDPVVVPDRMSLPEPDIAVVVPGDHLHEHPSAAYLVIEVAKTSLKTDLHVKPPLYAAMGVPDHWVVDVVARRVHVHRDPTPDGYATITAHGPSGTLAPLAVDVPPLDLHALFDGLR
jgi:Uma2 family endonuclease